MKARAFALMTTAILFLAAALAGSASDIDNCCFVDRQCSTDQEWVDGYWAFQNNQCSAPAGSGPTGGAPAQIDNCCFVDRQCHSDQQWIDGYHAYQNNQCGAPPQSQTVASSRSASGVLLRTASGVVIGYPSGGSILPTTSQYVQPAPGQIISTNNCCELTWQCNSDQDWAAGYHALQNHSCALPGVISIVGAPDFVDYYKRALDLLKTRLPQRYDYVLNGLDKVEQASYKQWSNVSPGLRIFFVAGGDSMPAHTGWAIREPAVLVHEACHVHRYDAGFRIVVGDDEAWTREEVICREMELEVLIELDAAPHIIAWAREMVEDTRSGDASPSLQGESS